MIVRRSISLLILGSLLFVLLVQKGNAGDSSLQSDINGLRSRVTRLESEVGFLKSSLRQRSSPSPSNARSPTPAVSGEANLSQNPQFKNLALKVAELQQDLEYLEKRLNQLNQQR
jgi:hypothetical protein